MIGRITCENQGDPFTRLAAMFFNLSVYEVGNYGSAEETSVRTKNSS